MSVPNATQEGFNVAFQDTIKALQDSAVSSGITAEQFNIMATEEETAANNADILAAKLGLLPEEIESLNTSITSGSKSFFNFGEMIKKAYGEGGKGLEEFIQDLDYQLAAQAAWATNVGILAERGATNLVAALAAEGPAAAQALADAVKLDGPALAELEAKFADAAATGMDSFAAELLAASQSDSPRTAVKEVIEKYNQLFEEEPMTPTVDTEPAARAIAGFLLGETGKRIPLYVDLLPGNQGVGFRQSSSGGGASLLSMYKLAAGGPVFGAGTSTSDSIHAMLSNNEFVVKADSTKSLGLGVLNYMNKYGRLPMFASGGPVGGGSRAAASGGSGEVRLDSYTIKMLARQGATLVLPDGRVLAQVVAQADAQSTGRTRR